MSDYARTIIRYTPLSPYTRHCSQPLHVSASHPFPGDKAAGGRSERTPESSKNYRLTLDHPHIRKGSQLLPMLPPPSSLCCPRPPSHHPSNLTSFYPVPAFHLLPPSTLIAIRDIHSLHVSKSSQYSLIHSTRQLLFYSIFLRTSSFLNVSAHYHSRRKSPPRTALVNSTC